MSLFGSSAASAAGDTIKHCKWCERTSDEVKWARKDGQECSSCRSYIKSEEDKKELEANIKKGNRRDRYKAGLEKWEARRAGSQRKPRAAHAREVSVVSSSSVKSSLLFAHFWPTKIWEGFFKKTLAKSRITTYEHNGKKYRGCYEFPSKGWTEGVLKLESISCSTVSKEATALSSSDESEEAVQKFNKLQKHAQVSASANKDGDLNVKAAAGKKRKKADDSSSDFFGDVWDCCIGAKKDSDASDGGNEKGDGASVKKKRKLTAGGKKRKAAGDATQETPNKRPKADNSDLALVPVCSLSPKEQLKRHSAIASAQSTILEATQLLQKFASAVMFQSVTVKVATAIRDKVAKNLSDDKIALYSALYASDQSTPATPGDEGMQVLGTLQSIKTKLDCLVDLVTCIHAKSGEPGFEPAMFKLACSSAKDVGMSLPSNLAEQLASRTSHGAIDSEAFNEWANSCSKDSLAESYSACSSAPLTEEAAASMQSAMILRFYRDLSRRSEAGKPVYRKHLEATLEGLKTIKIEDTELADTLGQVRCMTDPKSVPDIKDVVAAKDALTLNENNPFFKCFTLFPVGIEVAKSCIAYINQYKLDEQHAVNLKQCLAAVKEAVAKSIPKVKLSNLAITISEGAALEKQLAIHATIRATASEDFMNREEATIKDLEKELASLMGAVHDAFWKACDAVLQPKAKKASDYLKWVTSNAALALAPAENSKGKSKPKGLPAASKFTVEDIRGPLQELLKLLAAGEGQINSRILSCIGAASSKAFKEVVARTTHAVKAFNDAVVIFFASKAGLIDTTCKSALDIVRLASEVDQMPTNMKHFGDILRAAEETTLSHAVACVVSMTQSMHPFIKAVSDAKGGGSLLDKSITGEFSPKRSNQRLMPALTAFAQQMLPRLRTKECPAPLQKVPLQYVIMGPALIQLAQFAVHAAAEMMKLQGSPHDVAGSAAKLIASTFLSAGQDFATFDEQFSIVCPLPEEKDSEDPVRANLLAAKNHCLSAAHAVAEQAVMSVRQSVEGCIASAHNVFKKDEGLTGLKKMIEGSDFSDSATLDALMKATQTEAANTVHDTWLAFRAARKHMKSLRAVATEQEFLKGTVGVVKNFEEHDGFFDSDMFKEVRDTLGMLVSVQACFRPLKPGESRLGVTGKTKNGVEHEGMCLPKNLAMSLQTFSKQGESDGQREQGEEEEEEEEDEEEADDEDGL